MFIDMHQDVLYHLRGGGGVKAGSQTSFDMLSRGELKIVFGSIFLEPQAYWSDGFPGQDLTAEDASREIGLEMQAYGQETVSERGRCLRCVESRAQAQEILAGDQVGLLIHLEGLNEWPNDNFRSLDTWYLMGLRSLAIVWNEANDLGGGCSDPYYGLTRLGENVLRWCEERGVLVDLAHANKRTFQRALKVIDGPVIVSHANAAGLCLHSRNLSDWQLKAVAARGGVVGITFVNSFVVADGRRATVADVADHVEYVREVAGLDCVAIGSDFGGILGQTPEGLESVEQLPNLWAELAGRSWSKANIEQVAWRNAARVIKQVLK